MSAQNDPIQDMTHALNQNSIRRSGGNALGSSGFPLPGTGPVDLTDFGARILDNSIAFAGAAANSGKFAFTTSLLPASLIQPFVSLWLLLRGITEALKGVVDGKTSADYVIEKWDCEYPEVFISIILDMLFRGGYSEEAKANLEYLLEYFTWCALEDLETWISGFGLPPNAPYVSMSLEELKNIISRLKSLISYLESHDCLTKDEADRLRKRLKDAEDGASGSTMSSGGSAGRGGASAALLDALVDVRKVLRDKNYDCPKKKPTEWYPPPWR